MRTYDGIVLIKSWIKRQTATAFDSYAYKKFGTISIKTGLFHLKHEATHISARAVFSANTSNARVDSLFPNKSLR